MFDPEHVLNQLKNQTIDPAHVRWHRGSKPLQRGAGGGGKEPGQPGGRLESTSPTGIFLGMQTWEETPIFRRDYIFHLACERLWIPLEEQESVAGKGDAWSTQLGSAATATQDVNRWLFKSSNQLFDVINMG